MARRLNVAYAVYPNPNQHTNEPIRRHRTKDLGILQPRAAYNPGVQRFC
jgi:hypothetical protein